MRKKILIVEDDPLLADALAMLVEDDLACTPMMADSVSGALPLLSDAVDLALLDVEVRDGVTYPLASRLIGQGVPVLFVSGSDPARVPSDVSRVPFLRKPVPPTQLLSAARQYL